MDNPETLATLGTQEWTIQRHWQHWAHKTQDKGQRKPKEQSRMDNPETLDRQSKDTVNIGHTRHRTKTNTTQTT